MNLQLPRRIESDDLVIRLWTPDDLTAMHELIVESLDHLRPWMAWADSEPLTAERRLRLFGQWRDYWRSGNGAVYAVVLAGELVGGCALHRRVGPGGLDIGYWLGARAIGRGIAAQTAEALTAAAFAQPGVDFVQISHSADNARSASVPRKLGFRDVTPTAELHATHWRQDRVS